MRVLNTRKSPGMSSVNLKGSFFCGGEKIIMGVFLVHSPPQAGTPQSSASQRPASDQDSDCVTIQVRPQPSPLQCGEMKPEHVCLFILKSDPGGSGSAGGHRLGVGLVQQA